MSDQKRKAIHTDQAPKAIGPYSQALEVDGWVYCSGQIPIVPEDGSIVRGVEQQAHQALKNLGEVLQAADCSFGDVVKTQVYLADMADFDVVNKVYSQNLSLLVDLHSLSCTHKYLLFQNQYQSL